MTPGISEQLRRLAGLDDPDVPVVDGALLLAAADRPGTLTHPYQRHLARLALETGIYAGNDGRTDDVDLQAEALRQVIAKRYGYHGADYVEGDPESANLMGVIDQRCGLPLLLSVLYLGTARQLGWAAEGLDFPARFLVRLEGRGRRVIIDPYDGGCVLSPRDLREIHKATAGSAAEITFADYRPLGNREILIRIQNAVKSRLLRAENLEEALHVLRTTMLFAPQTAYLWREAGILLARLDRVGEAVSSLEEYLKRSDGDKARFRATILLQELRERLT